MNKKILLIGIFIFLISTYFSYSFFSDFSSSPLKLAAVNYNPPKENKEVATPDPESPKTEECPLNGELLTQTHKNLWEKRRPLGVMIENHLDARPQSGLTTADVIYEAVAEGGITRFLAIFYCKDSDGYIGPVRSARIYFLSLLQEYGNYPLYAHVGGANTPGPADALGEIRDLGWDTYNDMNQFGIPFPYYWRDYDRLPDRATEHTVYSTTKKLWDYARAKRGLTDKDKKGEQWDKNIKPWKFKDDSSNKGSLTKISLQFWENRTDYNVEWQYDKKSNTFKRLNGGVAHKDKNNDKQVRANNVVVVFMEESPANDGYPGGHLIYSTTGEGKAIVFQDGKALEGVWKKSSHDSRMRIYDSKGAEISFNRGQIWFEIIPEGNEIDYK